MEHKRRQVGHCLLWLCLHSPQSLYLSDSKSNELRFSQVTPMAGCRAYFGCTASEKRVAGPWQREWAGLSLTWQLLTHFPAFGGSGSFEAMYQPAGPWQAAGRSRHSVTPLGYPSAAWESSCSHPFRFLKPKRNWNLKAIRFEEEKYVFKSVVISPLIC